MLIFRYGSWIHILTLILVAGLIVGVYFLLRKKPREIKLRLLYILAVVNVVQHLFKFWIWPHVWGTGFSHSNTAYNVCAVMIFLTPFFLSKNSGAWRETVAYIGTFGCALSIFIPYWFVGQSLAKFGIFWEYMRFLFCHTTLLATSLLPALWGMVRFRLKNFWKIGLCFFTVLAAILVNDVLCICTGLTGGSAATLYETLAELNPLWMFRPPDNFQFYVKIITALSPAIFLGGKSGVYTPILWYFVPVYCGITLLAALLNFLAERYLPKDGADAEEWLLPHGKPHSFL